MQTPLALGAALLAVLIWLFSRRRPQLSAPGIHRSDASSAPAALSQPISAAPSAPRSAAAAAYSGQSTAPQKPQRLRQLSQAMQAGPSARLAVIHALLASPDRRALPLIRRGLRDSDPAVVQAAARAMAQFRGRPAGAAMASPLVASKLRLPRNAAPRA